MAKFTVNPSRFDPYRSFKFRVKWDGEYVPGILRVSPLLRKTEDIIYREGDYPTSMSVSPGLTAFEPIVLERGLTHDRAFEEWANLVFKLGGDPPMSLAHFRKDIIIDLFNMQNTKVMSFKVFRCWVSEYQALPALDSTKNCIAIERLVLQHEGWERDTDVPEPTET